MDLFKSDGINETVRIIGIILKMVRVSLEKNLTNVIAGLLVQNVVDTLLQLSFSAASICVRTVATKAVCLLLPYSTPAQIDSMARNLNPMITSFCEFLVLQIGDDLNPFTSMRQNSKVRIANSTECNLYLEMLEVLLSTPEGSVWNMELRRVLSLYFEAAKDTAKLLRELSENKICSEDVDESKFNQLVGFLSASRSDLGQYRFVPGKYCGHLFQKVIFHKNLC